MMKTMQVRLIGAWALVIAAALYPAARAAEEAGRVTFSFGAVTATAAEGGERVLRRGSPVYAGDTIDTGTRGRVQLRFKDRSFMSLVPETRFRIDEYRFRAEEEEQGRSIYSLLRGGLRALTGLIGRKQPESFQLNTAVATIGIRGTLFRTTFDPVTMRQVVSVGFDPSDPTRGILFTAGGVPLAVMPGGSAVVDGEGATPRMTIEQALVSAEPLSEGGDLVELGTNEPAFTGGQIASGADEGGVPGGSGAPVYEVLTYGPGGIAAASVSPDLGGSGFPPYPYTDTDNPDIDLDPDSDYGAIPDNVLDIVFVQDGAFAGGLGIEEYDDYDFYELSWYFDTIDPLLAESLADVLADEGLDVPADVQARLDAAITSFLEKPARVVDRTSDGATGIELARVTGGRALWIEYWYTEYDSIADEEVEIGVDELLGSQSSHYAYGPWATNIPAAGVGTYAFRAGTQSTTGSGGPVGGVALGQGLTGGTITVDFGAAYATAALSVTHGGAIDVQTTGNLFSGGNGFDTSGSAMGGPCSPSCGAHVAGQFTDVDGVGAAPDGIAAAYKLGTGSDHIMGAGAFGQSDYDPATRLR